jgi:hypothetical protein
VAAPVVTDDSLAEGTQAGDEPSWQELKGLFVDDPAAAVAGAGAKVDAALAALRDKGDSAGDTEALRLAFRRYQDIHTALSNV